jgi:hypothetical protein
MAQSKIVTLDLYFPHDPSPAERRELTAEVASLQDSLAIFAYQRTVAVDVARTVIEDWKGIAITPRGNDRIASIQLLRPNDFFRFCAEADRFYATFAGHHYMVQYCAEAKRPTQMRRSK